MADADLMAAVGHPEHNFGALVRLFSIPRGTSAPSLPSSMALLSSMAG